MLFISIILFPLGFYTMVSVAQLGRVSEIVDYLLLRALEENEGWFYFDKGSPVLIKQFHTPAYRATFADVCQKLQALSEIHPNHTPIMARLTSCVHIVPGFYQMDTSGSTATEYDFDRVWLHVSVGDLAVESRRVIGKDQWHLETILGVATDYVCKMIEFKTVVSIIPFCKEITKQTGWPTATGCIRINQIYQPDRRGHFRAMTFDELLNDLGRKVNDATSAGNDATDICLLVVDYMLKIMLQRMQLESILMECKRIVEENNNAQWNFQACQQILKYGSEVDEPDEIDTNVCNLKQL